jgi:thioesterase domain-containing protein
MTSADVAALQQEIHAGIPLSQAMGFEITDLDGHAISVTAPLAPNVNVHSTGFAGSLYAVGILTGWGMVRHLIRRRGLTAELVVAEAGIRYRAPVRGDITCRCAVPKGQAETFVAQLESAGRARLVIEVSIGRAGAARLTATMAAQVAAD